jgi:hypothetical protein
MMMIIMIGMNEKITKATALEVFADKGIRVYRLGFEKEKQVERVGFVKIDLSKFESEKQLFFNKNEDGTVSVNIHNCPDLAKSGADVFYAWERRLGRMSTTCPRCKRRLDSKPKRSA